MSRAVSNKDTYSFDFKAYYCGKNTGTHHKFVRHMAHLSNSPVPPPSIFCLIIVQLWFGSDRHMGH